MRAIGLHAIRPVKINLEYHHPGSVVKIDMVMPGIAVAGMVGPNGTGKYGMAVGEYFHGAATLQNTVARIHLIEFKNLAFEGKGSRFGLAFRGRVNLLLVV
jgi:hypothetical protein